MTSAREDVEITNYERYSAYEDNYASDDAYVYVATSRTSRPPARRKVLVCPTVWQTIIMGCDQEFFSRAVSQMY